MSYLDQMKKWIAEHPNATAEEAFQAGYRQAIYNWVNKIFGKKDDTKRQKNN